MGLFRRSEPEERSYSLKQLGLLIGSESRNLKSVSMPDDALRNAAVWACVDVLAGSVSALPVDVVRESGQVRSLVTPTPSLIARPAVAVTLDVWLYQVMWSLLTDGNAFGIVAAVDGQGRPTQLELVDPTVVTERKYENGRASALVDGDPHRLYPFGDLWHVPGKMTKPGSPFALSPLQYAGSSIGTGLAAERFANQFFTDGAHPTAILRSSQELSEEQALGLKQAFRRATARNREPLVMGAGVEYQAIQTPVADTEAINLMRYEVEQVCRFYRVPPTMVYGAVSGQSVTYANVSQADLHYLKHSLDGYLVRIERALTEALPRPQVVKFNRDALLRTDTLTRYQAHEIGLRSGFLLPDEVRELEDRPPLPEGEGDSPLTDELSPDDPSEDAQEGDA